MIDGKAITGNKGELVSFSYPLSFLLNVKRSVKKKSIKRCRVSVDPHVNKNLLFTSKIRGGV